MYHARHYAFPETVEEAAALLSARRNNAIVGGTCWMKQGKKTYDTLIDLSNLGLDQIEERDEYFEIGAMVTLRQLETDQGIKACFGDVFENMLKPIVGTQFRNCATVGGTVFGRYGFSDVLTLLMVLDTTVLTADGEAVPLDEFCARPRMKTLVTGIRVGKNIKEVGYNAFRRTATDLPVLTVAVSRRDGNWRISVGARPMTAMLCPEAAQALTAGDLNGAGAAVAALPYGTNMRGTKEYRKLLAPVLLERALKQIGGMEK